MYFNIKLENKFKEITLLVLILFRNMRNNFFTANSINLKVVELRQRLNHSFETINLIYIFQCNRLIILHATLWAQAPVHGFPPLALHVMYSREYTSAEWTRGSLWESSSSLDLETKLWALA